MRELQKQFTGIGEVRGNLFAQIQQSNKAYIYKVDTGCSIYYEVFKKKAKTNSVHHCYPTSKAFGLWAWTYQSLDKAINKFNELNKVRND